MQLVVLVEGSTNPQQIENQTDFGMSGTRGNIWMMIIMAACLCKMTAIHSKPINYGLIDLVDFLGCTFNYSMLHSFLIV